ncbi:MAG: hypothetical protein A3J27_13880 [Candidatus Tectomicrobia bacterium RIFCSPLOWO2_12_FULL_69_37]|nr:MAG: hypothetical protein A3J27_13880 [Candidatus Tectomicrobia bacterium RIFCSPLOWO2_12_FULL_69_37]
MAKRAPAAAPGEGAAAGWEAPYLYACVFLSGASILVLEIAAGRVLAPHFGNTLFTWTSMIGIILAALSLGYSVGGRLADRSPSSRTFYLILLLGAALVALVPVLRALLMPALEKGLSLRSGPIAGGVLLFAAPSFVLAALTPYAVKLQARDERLIGTVTGNLFTWSTVGSIAGTFATGFVFIPAFGLNSIFLATSVALALAGAGGLWVVRGSGTAAERKAARAAALLAAVCLAAGAAWAGRPPGRSPETVHFRENMYHTLRIQKWENQGRQILELFLDSQPEAAMVVGDDRALHFRYSRFLALGSAALPGMRSAFFLGGGGFTMPKALHLAQPGAEITVAELDPDVVAAGRKFFHLDRYPRIRVETGDGRRALRGSGRQWDFIVGDAYRGLRNIPPHLVTREFFGEVRARLAPGGAFLMNLIAHRAGPGGVLYASVYRTLASVFPDVWVFSTDPALPEAAQNVLFFAFRDRGEGRFRAVMEKLGADPRLAFIAGSRVAAPLPGAYGPILTDDYNPVEYLVAQGF